MRNTLEGVLFQTHCRIVICGFRILMCMQLGAITNGFLLRYGLYAVGIKYLKGKIL